MPVTFRNQTVGGGVVECDGVDIGGTQDDIEFKRATETLDGEDYIPLQTTGRVIIKEVVTLKVNMLEITAANASRASLNLAVTTYDGTLKTVSFHDAEAEVGEEGYAPSQLRTFRTFGGGSLKAISLDGPNAASVEVKSVNELTTYTSPTHYIIDAKSGRIIATPGSALDVDGFQVHVAYDYTPSAKQRLRLGLNLPIVDREMKVTHVSPVAGQIIVIHLWKCNGQGSLDLAMKKKNFWGCTMDMVATPDPDNHPDEPVGYIDFIPLAA